MVSVNSQLTEIHIQRFIQKKKEIHIQRYNLKENNRELTMSQQPPDLHYKL